MVKIYIFELTESEVKSSQFSSIEQKLVKEIVSKQSVISAENILLGKTKLGKPIIKKPRNSGLDISISHSGSYLVIGICDNGEIGVDLEHLKNIDYQVFKNYLTASEEMYINSGNKATQKLKNFYEIWTRKEAYLKALGTGLQKPLPITQFHLKSTRPKTKVIHNKKQYYLSTFKSDKFILSVCNTRSARYDRSYKKLILNNLVQLGKNVDFVL